MHGVSGNFYEFSEFRLDKDEKILWHEGSVVEVTPKALDILLILVENAGRIVRKEEIFERVWADSFVEDANLSHHIFRLRKALGEDSGQKFIETLPRRGYRFIAEVSEVNYDSTDKSPRDYKDSEDAIKPGKSALVAGLVVLLLVAVGFGFWFYNKSSASAEQINSIAVMPFVNESKNEEIEYLSDGMTETLISRLSQIPNLKVKARSSVFRYKGKETNAETVGKELNVQAILNGRIVQRGDDELVLYLSLVDTKTENQIWGEQYTRKVTNLIALQSEIARDVSENLKTKLSRADEQKLTKNYTKNADAYRLYLKGRYQLNRRTEESFIKAVEFFRQAIELDRDYALAYAGLADTYNQMGLWTTLPPAASFPKAKEAAEKALQLDDALAEAHTALACAKFLYDWDFAGAENEYQKAINLNPNYAYARELYGYHLYHVNPSRFDDAIRELKIAQELDPLSLTVNFNIAAVFYFEKRYDEALPPLKEIQNSDPNFTLGYGLLGAVYREKKMYDEMVETWIKGSSLEGAGFSVEELSVLRKAYKETGYKGFWRKYTEMLLAQSNKKYVSPIFPAMNYAMIGEKQLALEWLEKAYNERSSWLTEIGVDPVWDELRGEPRFQDLIKRIGLK